MAAAGLLAVTGAIKTLRPASATGALYAVGLPVPIAVVRAGAVLETAAGVAAILAGGAVTWALVAGCYLGFTAFLVIALRSPQRVVSCGCTAAADTPPTRSHLLLTLLSTAAAAGAAVGDAGGLAGQWRSAAAPQALTLVLFAVLVGWLGWLVLTALPRLRW